MRTYEIMTISKIELGDTNAKKISKEISEVISANKGEIVSADFWGKRKYAYEIDGAKEGYYDVIQFKIDPEGLKKLKEKLKFMDDLVRYLITARS